MIVHILKDGTRTTDITGRVVPFKDAETLYKYIAEKNRSTKKKPNPVHKRNNEVAV